ncbi:MAG TPA: galactitol-1-phosphate 5-dehydrogenase [Lacipirellulaceae bacterium]|nr:galactitol-1-phosphate 5-dehydrogenase [Lacipirellulaceae bacterium]
MKALLLSDYLKLELVDLPRPQIGPGDLLVRVAACGICGSDVHGYDGSTGRRIPPIVMGHEAAGVVEAVGPGVTRFQSGDRVTFDSTISCGDCEYCRAGRINLCDRREVLGVSCGDYRRNGAFAEFVTVPVRVAYALPDALPMEHAALIEAVSVAVHAVALTPAASGDDVIVVGAGMIGLLVIQALRSAGSGRILAVDVDGDRLSLAGRLGAALTFNASEGDVVADILAATGGRGAAAALEVVGTTATIDCAVRGVRKGGAVTLVGNLAPRAEIPLQMVVNREITLRGSCASNGEYPQCIKLMASGAIDVRPLITACIPLEDAPAWFERLHARERGLMKVVVQPNLQASAT